MFGFNWLSLVHISLLSGKPVALLKTYDLDLTKYFEINKLISA